MGVMRSAYVPRWGETRHRHKARNLDTFIAFAPRRDADFAWHLGQDLGFRCLNRIKEESNGHIKNHRY
jgi:hypothetical protein